MVLPLKWSLFGRTFACCYLFLRIIQQREIWIILCIFTFTTISKGMNHTSHKTQGERDAKNIIKNQRVDLQDLFHQSFLIRSWVIVLLSICSCSLLEQHTVCELWIYKLTKNIFRISNQRLHKNRLQKEGERGRTSDLPARRREKANKADNKVCRELNGWSYLS